MMSAQVLPIVEGHGEVEAVGVLVRRIALDLDPGLVPIVLHPMRISASKLRKSGELENAIEFAARRLAGAGGVLVVLDCDDGCPATEGPKLLERARLACRGLPVCVVLAKREFEAWFLAAAESLRGKRGLPMTLSRPGEPEEIRDAKGWLDQHLPSGRSYAETTDQPALTAVFDMDVARRNADSFDKCYRDIRHLIDSLRAR